jgi:hypothetical protein
MVQTQATFLADRKGEFVGHVLYLLHVGYVDWVFCG